jgi:hypothetical protein
MPKIAHQQRIANYQQPEEVWNLTIRKEHMQHVVKPVKELDALSQNVDSQCSTFSTAAKGAVAANG